MLSELARHRAAAVFISLTTLDSDLRKVMEPRTSPPAARLRAIEALSQAGIPVGVLVAPVIPGLTAKSTDGAAAFAYPIIFLPFISSAFVPTRSMPPVVRVFAENQPVTAIVDTIRALLAGQPVSQDIWIALAWCVGILVVAYIFAMRAYKKRV